MTKHCRRITAVITRALLTAAQILGDEYFEGK
jgi:hypothetical protein